MRPHGWRRSVRPMSRGARARPGTGLRRTVAALLRQRRRLVLATVAIALGVGYLAGALTLLDRVGAGLDSLARSGAENADLVVEGGVAYQSPIEQVRRLVPDTITPSLRRIPGVRSVSPRIEDIAVIIRPDGTPVVSPGLSEQPLGANWPSDPAVSPWRFVEGGPPTSDQEVVIDRTSALAAGVGVGDRIGVAGKGKVAEYRIAGVLRPDSGALPDGASLAVFTTQEARAVFDRPLDDNSIALRLEPGADVEEVRGAVRRALPTGIEVVDGTTAAIHRQEGLTRSFTIIRSLIMGFAGLALLVGMVTVANSLALLYGERRRTFASLRLVGARPRQLLVAALVEAALLAVAASLVGAPLGLLLGRLIEAALGALDTAVPVAGSVVSWRALGWAVVLGVLATVVAAAWPAARACRVSPVEAVTEAAAPRGRPLLRSLATTAVVALLAGAGTAILLVQGGSSTRAVAAGGGVAAGIAVLGLLPVVLASAVAAGVRLVPLRPRTLRRIAARDVGRNRTRTAATAAALILATAVVAGLAVFLSSFAASVDGEVRRTVSADLVVDSGTFTRGGLPADLLERIRDLPEVAAVSGWQVGRATSGLTPLRLTGVDGDGLDEVLRPDWVGAAPARLDDTSILLSDRAASSLGASVGSIVPVTFTSGGVESLRVAGIYSGGGVLLGDGVVDRSVIDRQVPATTDIAGLVTLRSDTPAAREAVRDLSASYGIDSVLRPSEFVDRRSDLLRGFQRVIEWMLLFTLVQALVGVVNTLLLSVGERRREFGLLRAAGASRRQVLRLVLAEGVALAVVGTVVGLGLGVLGARLGLRALASSGIDSFVVPVTTLVVVAVAAAALGVAASVLPARWASRVPALVAVSDVGDLEVRPRRSRELRRRRRGVPAFHFEYGRAPVAPAAPLAHPLLVPPPVPDWVVPMRTGALLPPPATEQAPQPMFGAAAAAPAPAEPVTAPVPRPTPVPHPTPVGPAPLFGSGAAPMFGSGTAPVSAPAPAAPPPVPEVLVPSEVPSVVEEPPVIHSAPLFGATVVEPEPESVPPVFAEQVEQDPVLPVFPEPVPAVEPAPESVPPVFAEQVDQDPVLPVFPEPVPPVFAEQVDQDPVPPVFPEPVPVVGPAPESVPPVFAEPEPVVVVTEPEAEPVRVDGGPVVVEPVEPEPVAAPAEPAVVEPVAARTADPELDLPVATPGRRGRRNKPGRPTTGTTRRRRDRAAASAAAEGWIRSGGPTRPPWGPGPAGPTGPGARDEEPPSAAGDPGDNGLSAVLGRSDRRSVERSAGAAALLGGALAPGESVHAAVAGLVRGLPAMVARTDRRLVVVVDRPGRPFLQSLNPRRTDVRVEQVASGPATVLVLEGERRLEVTDVVDVEEAMRLAGDRG